MVRGLGAVTLTVLSTCAHQLWSHAALRLIIGWTSGWAMVLVAAWTNDQLLRLRRPALSAAVFAGPGAGIFVSGMLAMLLHYCRVDAATAWLVYGAVAAVLIAIISRNLPRSGTLVHPTQAVSLPTLSLPLKNWYGAILWRASAISCPPPSYRRWRRSAFPAAPLANGYGRYLAPPASPASYSVSSPVTGCPPAAAWR
ncbi:hypothetical protein SODG_005361 [Sodalis praecaptivus]